MEPDDTMTGGAAESEPVHSKETELRESAKAFGEAFDAARRAGFAVTWPMTRQEADSLLVGETAAVRVGVDEADPTRTVVVETTKTTIEPEPTVI